MGARLVWGVGFLDSGFRRNDGGGGGWFVGVRLVKAGMWIPAFAGMTVEGGGGLVGVRLVKAGMWIPAFAGMTVEGGGVGFVGRGWYWHGFLDSGLRRNDGLGAGMTVKGGNNGSRRGHDEGRRGWQGWFVLGISGFRLSPE